MLAVNTSEHNLWKITQKPARGKHSSLVNIFTEMIELYRFVTQTILAENSAQATSCHGQMKIMIFKIFFKFFFQESKLEEVKQSMIFFLTDGHATAGDIIIKLFPLPYCKYVD